MADDSAVPPPIQHLPTAKEKKYDRQLRLWAAAGQAALEDAHILLINSGPGVTGVEALKNLILPGVGQFTILDPAVVSQEDLGVNFFLDESSLGKSRAEETTRYLLELNPDVRGQAVSESVEDFLESYDRLQHYTLILAASPIRPHSLDKLVSHCSANRVPLFYMHSVGFHSQFSIALPNTFPIVDTHPDPASTTDLRLLAPWPELVQFTKSKTSDLGNLTDYERGHTPYLLLLLHYLDEWRSSHNGQAPSSYKEKTDFRESVRASGPPEEENYAEACAAVLKTLNQTQPSSSILAIRGAMAERLTSTSAPFWYIASAVFGDFFQTYSQLPLPGNLPDMKAQSTDYVQLQSIYKSKARADAAEVLAHVRALEAKHSRQGQPIDAAEVDQFCKLAAHVKLIHGSFTPIHLALRPLDWTAAQGEALVAALPNPEFGIESSVLLTVAFVAYDTFLAAHDLRAPGQTSDEDIDAELEELMQNAEAVLAAAFRAAGKKQGDIDPTSELYTSWRTELQGYCMELIRAGGGELHNIASLTGGIVAQEVIKVITKQYVPADNTVVFDGVTSKTGVYRL